MNIYLVRHGDDDERYRGGWSELPLVEEGIRKCEKLGEYLYNHKSEFNIEKIISSDLTRAKMTADIINEKLKLPIVYDKRLRENNNGIFAGMLNEKAIKEYPNAFFSNLEYDERFPQGESPREFFERIKKAFFEIIDENSDIGNLMIVTHAGVISIIYHVINNIKWTNKVKALKIAKTSISKIVIDDDKNIKYDYQNYTPHLEN